ncbi:MAG: phosphatase PAP2 family protein [Anaerolineaceae bacterium]|nr:phosphatase PAP2 family protein [Anaerolineaceae bacterium]
MTQPSPDIKVQAGWGRIKLWVRAHQGAIRLISLTCGLILFLALVPAPMRITFWESLQSHKVLAIMLLVFNLLALSLIWSAGQQVDAWAFLLFNLRGSRPLWLDRTMLGFTQIGNGLSSLGIALLLFLFSEHLLAYEIILGTLTLWMVVELVKAIIHRSRPFIKLVQTRIVGFRPIGRSFPSGHTSQAFFMATLIVQSTHASVWAGLILYGLAILVGLTRMYVGAHYPRDVLAGAILGTAWGLLGIIVDGYMFKGAG